MTFTDYQIQATQTQQTYNSEDKTNFFLGYLGLAGEAGSVLTTLKKLLRDGEGFGTFKDRLSEELGDVLWYVSSIASHYNINLEDIAQLNLMKTQDRFLETSLESIPRFDESYPEKFPDEFVVIFKEDFGPNDLLTVSMEWQTGEGELQPLGDPLTDNSRFPNNYRYHDVFHLGHVAFLGWSPVIRDLMKLKRKSDIETLDGEDRGRPQVAEEAVTLFVYNYARGNKMLKESDRLDTELLNTVKQLVYDLEVSKVTAFQWETAIVQSYKVYHLILENRGGKVLVSPKNRKLEYLG
ncbi:MazG nucleotide pyrophosphohydrolase domain-containing protein [Mucilaginibacter gossypiicola]|uniref:MazG nucleotide pyrophosphohydrolase domain-containing protein n=1 Tax=Mucilaginibacter gossypiicola TaxID=551995 RepID=A0A1H8V1Y8_9SPHI|nr:nucleoside triphosphate pyrophosphohydrolase family protein [Mucilaginibacter gossypiicola]SEP08778.1 MazG nucleotide pyrophosphohydrolase domain-containing protein [Mucilaginibacter gossypiicola]